MENQHETQLIITCSKFQLHQFHSEGFVGFAFLKIIQVVSESEVEINQTELYAMRRPTRVFTTMNAFAHIARYGIPLESHKSQFQNWQSSEAALETMRPRIRIEDNLLEPEDEENLKRAVALIGPISVNNKVTQNFFFYETGVFYDLGCQ